MGIVLLMPLLLNPSTLMLLDSMVQSHAPYFLLLMRILLDTLKTYLIQNLMVGKVALGELK